MPLLHGVCWVITDHAAGNQRQAMALADCLGLPVRRLVVAPRAPWSWLAPHLVAGGGLALPRDLLQSPWPQVAIGCGRQAALVTRLLRRWSHGACYSVQILDPHAATRHWDKVIAPRHDLLRGPNVLTPLGSLHPIDDAWLERARQTHAALAALPRPRLGVLLGGPRKGVAVDANYGRQLAQALHARQRAEGGSVLVVASRRTPEALLDAFAPWRTQLPGLVWAGAADGANPYPGILGWADEFIVTPDSVNMLSEACATGRPVRSVLTAPLPPRLARFHAALHAAGWLAPDIDTPLPLVAPLRETRGIALAVAQAINARQAAS